MGVNQDGESMARLRLRLQQQSKIQRCVFEFSDASDDRRGTTTKSYCIMSISCRVWAGRKSWNTVSQNNGWCFKTSLQVTDPCLLWNLFMYWIYCLCLGRWPTPFKANLWHHKQDFDGFEVAVGNLRWWLYLSPSHHHLTYWNINDELSRGNSFQDEILMYVPLISVPRTLKGISYLKDLIM